MEGLESIVQGKHSQMEQLESGTGFLICKPRILPSGLLSSGPETRDGNQHFCSHAAGLDLS